jgi:hypothetical protein
MNQIVQQLYEHGDTGQLIATAQGAGIITDDCSGALQALRLLARLGDQDAAAFCGSAPEACSSVTRAAH